MMKIPGKVTDCCVALLLAMTSVSAVRKINSFSDLKEINFGQNVPKHSLLLLYWFASVVDIDRNYVIQLTFDPNNEDYGSHYYGNYEKLLDPLPYRHNYYTVGNLKQSTSGKSQLPHYVANPDREYNGGNRDRIIIRVRQQNSGWHTVQIIDQVYITQHYGDSVNARYDEQNTYEISINLLRQIRQFSDGTNLSILIHRFGININDFQLCDIRNTWGDLAGLGLLLFCVIRGGRVNYTNQSARYTNQQNRTLHSARYIQPYNTQVFPENAFSESGIIVLILLCVVVFLLFLASIHVPK